ncbi:MAG: NAD(+) synthase [Planctomycetes bacterium]|nr:NAD(+) synthase [Planctomycetota bacterium]
MPSAASSFFDLNAHGFVRVAVAVPAMALADPGSNGARVIGLFEQAVARGASLVLFPELSLSGYALDDLHQQDALLDAVRAALARVVDATRGRPALLLVGAPLRFGARLFNCAVAVADGRVLGVVPKSYLPTYREFYEKRQFAAARDALEGEVELLGVRVPFGADLLFREATRADLCVHAEICEDVWVPVPPSTWAALRGATILANLSASNITVGKASYRHQLAAGQSAKLLAAYLYSGAGSGESTTDLAWDGHALIYENGQCLAESERFADEAQVVYADVDLDRLVQERARMTSFVDCATDHRARLAALRTVEFGLPVRKDVTLLERRVERLPYVPGDPALRDERCFEAYNVQVAGLVQRLRSSGVKKVVIGVSGGLDSTQALIVSARAMDHLGLPRTNVLAYTLPGYATSAATLSSARRLMAALGTSAEEIDIRPSCQRMFEDVGHPFARGEPLYDVTFENVQAGQRTSLLFRLANRHSALVVGTGDLSELALGWCTYGVGDHMSHYNVNASVPKTLVRHLIGWVAEQQETSAEAADVLRAILETEISPELVPGDDDGRPAQSTEAAVGPYELHDFTLYHVTRRGYAPAKVAFLALHAWANDVPGGTSDAPYTADEVLRWQRVFLDRFFRTSQFKRSCVPNGPKVGSGGSLSPRGDWRAPSDASAAPWLAAHDEAAAWVARSR